jgi:hypothetical protein
MHLVKNGQSFLCLLPDLHQKLLYPYEIEPNALIAQVLPSELN